MNVLLVEDDPGIGRAVSRGLSARGYRIAWERDGSRAVELLAGGGFSAALLDLGLPDIDGLDLCRGLRAARIDTPVLMLTARGALQDRLDGFDAGADDYLPKPFAFDELLARLAVLVRRGGMPVRKVAASGLMLDPVRHSATIAETTVLLSRREFALLAALHDAVGEPVSRDVLARSVWGDDAVTDNALDVYVGYVRRRLAALPDAPTVEAVRGVGFRLRTGRKDEDNLRSL